MASYAGFDLLPGRMCVIDDAGRIRFVNRSWRRFADESGLSGHDFLGQSYVDVCLRAGGAEAPEAEAFAMRLLRLLDGGDERSFSSIYPCHSSRARKWFRVSVSATPDGAIIAHEDVTGDRLLRDDAEDALVTAAIVHDLRSPLTAVLGFADIARNLIERDGDRARTLECLSMISQSGYRMLDVVEELMRDAEAAHREAENDSARVPLDGLVAEVLAQARPAADAAEVTCRHRPSTPRAVILGENHGLWKVVSNLVTNAVKYNRPGGSVTVSTTRDAVGGIELTVADDGIGMPQTGLVGMFQPFARGKGEARRRKGNGIGLAVVREIIHRHEGMIRVASAPGVGTSITVVFPSWRTVDGAD